MATTSAGLSAGTAAATITPEQPMQLQGYDRGPSTGTLDPLEARAIVFDDGNTQAAIVTADLIGLEYAHDGPECASVQRIRASAAAASGVPAGHIMVACSHTHSGPAVQQLSYLPADQEYQRSLEQTLGAVVGAASRAMQPVTLGVGDGMVDINVNRRLRTPDGNTAMRPNRQGMVDKRVRVLRVDPASAPAPIGTLGGRPLPQSDPLAVLFSYVCHATTMGGENFRYSADYPGSARRVVEGVYQANGGAGTRALFLPGCFGNIRPHLLRPDESFRGATDHELLVLGRLLGSEVVQTAERVVSEPVTAIAVARREVSLPYGALPSEAELRAAAADQRRSGWATAMLAHIERDGSLPTADTAEVQVMRLGPHWLVTTPGETQLEIGLSIERGFADLGLAQPERGEQVITLGYTNGNVGYLCTASTIFEGGYEPSTAYSGYRRPAAFAPEAEAVLIDTALALAQEIVHAQR